MKSTKTMLAYDSAEHLFQATGQRVSLPNRHGCPLVTRDLHEIAADALDLRRAAPAVLPASEREAVLAMFPHMNRLG
jgi:hypothetical protein